ncbi:MAG: hypothetical protein H0V17_04075 [Deltaproteobacteria bacterium]|nr:hypothetical protein [Deltaproteobacteria bacterium]
MKETLAALFVGVAIAAVVSCGGSKSAMKTAAPQSSAEPSVMPGSPRDRIKQLDDQIVAELAKLELQPPPLAVCPQPPCATMQTLAVKPTDDPACKRSAVQVCKDHCVLADSICDSASKICEIAKELASDVWASEKCASGNASCTAAHGKCCGCT